MRLTPTQKSLRTLVRKTRKTGTYEWRNFWRRQPVSADTVLYESFSGNGMVDNPEAIFRRLLADPSFGHLKHIWVLADPDEHRSTVAQFAKDPRVSFVRYLSPQYFRALATAKYLFNNATFPPEFSKRAEQVYVNTWHGTPLKAMGYDTPGGGPGSRNVIRNFLAADYLLSSSPYMTEQMYERAFRLGNIYQGRVITEGFPRVDRQFISESDRAGVRAQLRRSGVTLRDDQKVVLYAPTWRGESFQSPTNDVAILGERVRAIRAGLSDDHQVLLKVHQQVYKFAIEHPDLSDILVPNDIPSNAVLAVTDVLINDYSSIFFDFLATGRPIIFFTPDRHDYGENRGLYLEEAELPGPVVSRIRDLTPLIRAAGTGEEKDPSKTHQDAYSAARERFVPKDDGDASARIIDVVLRGNAHAHDVRPIPGDGRQRILIYLGGMRSNGITASVLNLLANLDHDRFDVTAFYNYSRRAECLRNEAAIDPNVRVIPRIGGITPSKWHRRQRVRLQTIGMDAPGLNLESMHALFAEEWRRCFGSAEFDYVIDYSGYAPFWSFLLMQGKARSHSIWLHSDLKSDQLREVDGRRPHEQNLRAVFSTYAGYDNLVSVSSALSAMNAEKLADSAPLSKHTWAQNTINHQRILTMAYGARPAAGAAAADELMSVPAADLPAAVGALAARHSLTAIGDEVIRRQSVARLAPAEDGVTTFVAVGRLSPEKNYPRLIQAFDLVHQEFPGTRLIIMGGGPLLVDLEALVVRLGLSEAVVLAGQQPNPYAVMAQADCFVLSSDYEGQPMVFLEARVLDLPIVSTDFPSVKSALPPGTGLVVPSTSEALAEGMSFALADKVPKAPFDPVAYNREAIDEFYRAIGADA